MDKLNVVPIHRTGKKTKQILSNVRNSRPLSLMPICGKIFDIFFIEKRLNIIIYVVLQQGAFTRNHGIYLSFEKCYESGFCFDIFNS